jgi:hypothetical protein
VLRCIMWELLQSLGLSVHMEDLTTAFTTHVKLSHTGKQHYHSTQNYHIHANNSASQPQPP